MYISIERTCFKVTDSDFYSHSVMNFFSLVPDEGKYLCMFVCIDKAVLKIESLSNCFINITDSSLFIL